MHSTRHTRAGPICNCSNQGATLIGIAACAQPFSVHLCGVALGWLLFPAGMLSLRIFKTAMEKVTVGSTAVVPGLAVQYQVCLCSSCKKHLGSAAWSAPIRCAAQLRKQKCSCSGKCSKSS